MIYVHCKGSGPVKVVYIYSIVLGTSLWCFFFKQTEVFGKGDKLLLKTVSYIYEITNLLELIEQYSTKNFTNNTNSF